METKAAEDDALIPLGRITSLQFSLVTSDEIIKVSRSEPIQFPGQLSGPLLGLPTESHKCSSCGTIKLDECEGHFGHIRLPTPVFHPSHIPVVVRILKSICLNCFKLKKKKKIMNDVTKVLPEKKPISYGTDLQGMKANSSINFKRKNSDAISIDASSNYEEDPLLCSLIPIRTYVQRTPCTPIKRNLIGCQKSKNFKFIKEIARSGLQQKKQSALLKKGNFNTSMSDAENNKEGTNCKYCMDVGKQSGQRYPRIDVKIVNAKTCNNEEFREIRIWLDKEIPLKFWDFVDRYSGHNYENEASRTLLPFEFLNILRQVPETTSKGFGVRPESLIWDCLPVPPNCTRISADSVKAMRISIDGATKMLKKIISAVGRIKESRGGKPTFDTRKHETKLLQSLCSQYLRARGGRKSPGDKEPFQVHGQSLGDAESFSKIWGERIATLFLQKLSRFSARGVLTGDAYIEIDEIGIPLEVAKSVTVEERITFYNKERMQNIVNQGLYSTLVDRGGNCRSKEFLEMVKTIEIGEIVHRQLSDGDTVIVNRPPSIHKHSIQALKVRIQPSCNFSISPLICPPMDADFDGDCIHVFVPQSLQSRAELSELLSLDQQLINSQSGQMLLMLTQDTLIAASLLLSMPLLNEITMHQLSMWALSAVPEPAIIRSPHGGPYWTGCQLFQMCLPPDFNCIGKGIYIQKSELVCILQGGKHSHDSVELILHTLIFQKGPREALKFLNSAQHTLTEWLSQEGLSVGLDDVHPFQDTTSKKYLADAVNKCVEDVAPRMKHMMLPGLEDAMVPYVQNHVHHTHNSISKCIFKSNSLIAIVEAGSGRSMNKVIQQTGFLGLQIYKGNELLPRGWSNWLFSSLNINSPLSAEVNFCEARGLIVSSITNGLKPHEAFIHAISSREALFSKAIEVKEPGRLSKQLMAFLRDIIICYDGTIRTTQGKHLVQFQYDLGPMTELSEWKGEKTKLRRHLQPGDPVGIHAATALTNPSYKVLLDSGQQNICSWYLLKEALTRRFRSKVQLPDRKVILRLRGCCCNHAYCSEKTALQIQNHLQKVPLKMFSISVEVGYYNTGKMEDFNGTAIEMVDSPFVGHIRLDKEILRKVNLSMDSLLLNLKRSIKTNGNPLNDMSDRLILHISENCKGAEHKEMDIQMPCLHFYLQGWDTSSTHENIWNIMIDEICPKLLEITAKGDDRIESISIEWSHVNLASWVPLQISTIQTMEGEITIEATIDSRKVKQRGDAWKIAHDACLPIMELLNTKRCIPYSIHEVYKSFGVSAAFYLLLQRLSHSMNTMGSHVYKEDLVLIANCMSFSGIVTGFSAAGYRELLHTVGISAPFTEGALEMPLKCFEKAAERGQEERLSSTLASCSWGQHPSVGTGGNFEFLYAVGASDPSSQLCKHEDVYDFLENIGMIPCGKEASSLESHLDENLCDEIDDTSEFMCSDVIFVDSPIEKGIANCDNGDVKSSWDAIPKSPDQTYGWEAFTKPNSQTDGWETSKKPDSQRDGWVCPMPGKEASKNHTPIQLSGWEASTKPDSTDGWEASTKPDSTDGWEASTKPDSNTDVWEASIKQDSQAEGWVYPMADKKVSKRQTTMQLSGWEASTNPNLQTNGWEASTNPNSQTNGWEASKELESHTDGWICSITDKEASKCQTNQLSGWEESTKPNSQAPLSGWEASIKPDSNTGGWEASTKLDSQTEGWFFPIAEKASKCQPTIQLSGWEASTEPNTQTDGWEASTKPDSQTDGWICSMAGKEAPECQTTIQLSGWEASTKPDSQTDGWEASKRLDSNTEGWEVLTKIDSQREGWVCPVADKKASKCQTTIQLSGWEASTKANMQTDGWKASTKPDSNTDGWEALTKLGSQTEGWEASTKPGSNTDGWEALRNLDSQTEGWVFPVADKKASKCQTTIQLSGWEASTKANMQTDGWKASTKPDSNTDGWEALTKLGSQTEGWEASTKPSSNTDGWEALTNLDSQTKGWVFPVADKKASKCQTTIQLSGWEASTKANTQTDGWEASTKANTQTDGWEASTKPDSETDGWICSMAGKESSKCQTTIQLSVWEESTKTDSQTDGWEASSKPDSQSDGWVSSIAKKEASKCQRSIQLSGWEASTKPDSQTDGWVSSISKKEASKCQRSIQLSGWEASTKPDSQTDGWVCSKADKKATKNARSIQLSGWEASTGWNLSADIAGCVSKCGENPWDSNWKHDEVRNLFSWDSNLRPKGKRHCTVGWTKIDSYSMSREDEWKCSEEEKGWKTGLQKDYITNISGWNSNVETAGEKDCSGGLQGNAIPNMSKSKDLNSAFASKKSARETGKTQFKTANSPHWKSNRETRGKNDYTYLNNHCSERIHQQEMTGMHDNQHSHFKSTLPRFQKTTAFEGKGSKGLQKNLEGNDMENKCRPEESGLKKDPSLPPGFSFQEDSSPGRKFSFQQNGKKNTGWPSSTDILTNSSLGNCAKEESEHKSSFSDVTVSDNSFKFKMTRANPVPLGKTRSFSKIQTEAHARNTFQEVELDQKIGKDSQATGSGVDWQTEVQEISSTRQQPIIQSMSVETSTRDTLSKGKSLTANTSCLVSNISDEDTTTNRHCSVNETKDKVIDLLKSEHSDGLEPYSESIVKPGWEGCNNEKIVSESYAVRSLSTDNLASPTWGGFSEGEHDKCDRSISDHSHTFKPTGANIVPLGRKLYRRAQLEEYDRNTIQESIQDQAVMKVMQLKERLLDCPVEETRSRGPDGEYKHAEFDIQNTSSLEKETIPSGNCHKSRTSGEDIVTPSNCNMETEENFGLTVKQGQDSDGWNQRPETITAGTGLRGWHNEHVTYDSKTPIKSGWEVENENNPVEKCTKKGMEYGRTSKGEGRISSSWSKKKDKVHRDYKNHTARKCSPRSCNTRRSVEQTSNGSPKLQGIFQEINPLLHSVRTILHFSSYNNGDRLRPEHEREILEKVLIHHPEAEGKMGCGVDFIMVDSHSVFNSSRCFYIVRKDGTKIDFSYLKCLKGLIEKKFPDSAKAFIEKYLSQRK